MKKGLCAAGMLAIVGVAGCSSFESSSTSSSAPNVDPFAVTRGALIVNALVGCGDCHTSDPTKPFAGGSQFAIDDAGHYVYSRNITPDPNTGLTLTEDQFVTMMQTGKDSKNPGQMLFVMPWVNFRWMTTDDIKAVYAFLQLLPPVNNQVQPDDKGMYASLEPVPMPTEYNEGEETRPLPPVSSPDLLGPPSESTQTPDPDHAVLGAAILPLAYARMPNFYNRTPDEQASFGRGSYLVNTAGCGHCHTNQGGQPRNMTPGPDFLKIYTDSYLTGGATFTDPSSLNTLLKQTRSMTQNLIGKSGYFNQAGDTTYMSFASEMDTISHADDSPPLSLGWPMPANHYRNLPEQDLIDIYTYMSILAEDYDHTNQNDKQTQDPARYCTSATDCQSGQTCWVDPSGSKTVNNQCLWTSCMTDADCDACQHCVNMACQAPSASDTCLTQGI